MIAVDKELLEIYQEIPAFHCKPGCTRCCGIVPWSGIEWRRIADKRAATGIACPYVRQGRCEIYDLRPIICRLFGAVDDGRIRCPEGCGPTFPLSQERAKWLIARVFGGYLEPGHYHLNI
ncbi:MAG TPA: hypothetical protein VJ019_10440 [Aestuariivirga sp.]|nr:hypothetical protein [Aestuariivirga sp.]